MPAYIDPKTGFPFWGNPSPQKSGSIPGRQVQMMLEDAAVNQVPSGRQDEIGIIQKPIPKQGKAEGASAGDLLEVGAFGSSLYDAFMQPYQPKGTP